MLKLVVISVLASVVSVQCGTILTPGRLVSEKVIESHGNSVVHSSAPVVAAVAQPAPFLRYADVALVQQPLAEIVQPLTKAALVAEKTIEAHGHQVVHNAQPLVAVAKPLAAIESYRVAIPTLPARGLAYAPIYYPAYPHQLVGEKTVSSYGHSIQHLAGHQTK